MLNDPPLLKHKILPRFWLKLSLIAIATGLPTIWLTNPGIAFTPFYSISQALLETKLEEAERLVQQGLQQYESSEFQEAIETWNAALEIYKDSYTHAALSQEIRTGEAKLLNYIGNAYDDLAQYELAVEYLEQSLMIAREIGDRHREGAVLGSLGVVYYNLGILQQAIDYQRQRLAIAQEIDDRSGEGAALNNLGLNFGRLGEFQQAINYYEQSLTITREAGDLLGESAVLGNLGIAYMSIGRYDRAINHHQQNLEIARELNYQVGEAAALGNLGLTYRHLGEYEPAINYFQQVLDITRSTEYRAWEGYTLGNLGSTYLALGEYSKATDLFQQQLVISAAIGDRFTEADALSGLGLANYYLGQYSRAIGYHEQHLAVTQEINDRSGEGYAFSNLGLAYQELGDFERAIDFYERQLVITRETGDRVEEAGALENLGSVWFSLGDFPKAEDLLFLAVNIFESIRSKELSEAQRISLIDNQLNTFHILQQVLIAQNRVNAALEISERARARVLLEELMLRLDSEAVNRLPEVMSPSTAQIQQIAKEHNSTLVEYSVVSDEALYIWVVQPSGEIIFRSVTLKNQPIDLAGMVATTRNSMGILRSIVSWGDNNDPPTSGSYQIRESLQQLHQILIEPIVEYLPEDPSQSIIFIPHNELFLVPFAALQDTDGSYLIDRHTILTAPAIQVLANTQAQQQQVRQANLQEMLVIGDPTMPPLSLVPGETPEFLQPLPGAEQEAIAIANLLDTAPLLGDAATKSAVVQQMPNARIIHLATHGILDESQGLNGGVVLAADGTGEFNDGLLTAAEIAQMELNAELVVLSACNTGQGRITGDGVIGLSRSLVLAGVPSVVVSLWAVPDAPTGELMVEFYRQLEQTDNKAQALRQAMLNIREEHPNPIAWAAFTLIGEAE